MGYYEYINRVPNQPVFTLRRHTLGPYERPRTLLNIQTLETEQPEQFGGREIPQPERVQDRNPI